MSLYCNCGLFATVSEILNFNYILFFVGGLYAQNDPKFTCCVKSFSLYNTPKLSFGKQETKL